LIEGNGVPEELVTVEEPVADAGNAGTGDAAARDATAAEAPAEQPAPAADGPTVAPAEVTVDVLNGTGTTGLGATVADLLRAQGFAVGDVGNEAGTVNETVVRHGPGVVEQARTAAAAVPGAVLQPSDAIGDTVQLVIGPGYSTVVPVEMPTAPAQPTQQAAPTTTAPQAAEPTPASC
jgi:hypothetical protein